MARPARSDLYGAEGRLHYPDRPLALPHLAFTLHLAPIKGGVDGSLLEPSWCVQQIFAELARKGGTPKRLMIDATHLKAHRTAASLLKKGLFPDVSGARRAA